MPQLVILGPDGSEKTLELEGDEFTLGRDPKTTIHLNDRKVSRKHARIFRRDGAYFVEDLGSSNGVVIAGQAIPGPTRLLTGAEFAIGPFRLNYFDDIEEGSENFALTGLTKPCRDQSFLLPPGELTVGRVESNAIVVDDASVSRQHAVLMVTVAGAVIEDMGSRNGTTVNGSKIGRRELRPGDLVRIGNVEFEFTALGGISGSVGGGYRSDVMGKTVLAMLGVIIALLAVTLVFVLVRNQDKATQGGLLERAYENNIQDRLREARTYIRRGEWVQAADAYEAILDKDPIHKEAMQGLFAAEDNQRHEQALIDAEAAMTRSRPEQAIRLLETIPTNTYFGAPAEALAVQAHEQLSRTTFKTAQKFCRKKDFAACHERIIEHLMHNPSSEKGKAVLTQAEDALLRANVSFVPWADPPPMEEVEIPDVDTLEQKYPDPSLRTAVLTYASGDVTTAINQAKMASDTEQGQQVIDAMKRVEEAKTAADGSAVGGDMIKAVASWETALQADAEIMPADQPSALRKEFGQAISKQMSESGQSMLAAGQYVAAYNLWSSGLKHDPSNTEILTGMKKLEARAQRLFDEATVSPDLGADACAKLTEAMNMTRPSADIHRKAKAKAAQCDG